MPAEVLLDAVDEVTGVPDNFPGCRRAAAPCKRGATRSESHFLDAFGRPNSSSDCPCERDVRPSVVQSLHLMNSKTLQAKLSASDGRLAQLAASSRPLQDLIEDLYFAALSRPPTDREMRVGLNAFESSEGTRQSAAEDLLWALLNSPEFVFNH